MQRHHTNPIRTVSLIAACITAAIIGAGCANAPGADPNVDSIITLFSPPTPQEAAIMAVDPYNADDRQIGLLLLANAPWGGEPVYLDLYRLALEDEDNGVRISALKGLALHGTPEDVPLIIPFLNSDDRLVRLEATQALERLHNPIAIRPLIERLDRRDERDADVRASAAVALGQYATPRTLDTLIGALEDDSLLVNRSASRSLRILTGQDDLALDVSKWIAWQRSTADPFADRKPYRYPVFKRDRRFVEYVVPFLSPPNEIAAAPAGMPPVDATRTN